MTGLLLQIKPTTITQNKSIQHSSVHTSTKAGHTVHTLFNSLHHASCKTD